MLEKFQLQPQFSLSKSFVFVYQGTSPRAAKKALDEAQNGTARKHDNDASSVKSGLSSWTYSSNTSQSLSGFSGTSVAGTSASMTSSVSCPSCGKIKKPKDSARTGGASEKIRRSRRKKSSCSGTSCGGCGKVKKGRAEVLAKQFEAQEASKLTEDNLSQLETKSEGGSVRSKPWSLPMFPQTGNEKHFKFETFGRFHEKRNNLALCRAEF